MVPSNASCGTHASGVTRGLWPLGFAAFAAAAVRPLTLPKVRQGA
jgi:hypothetical protein